MAIMELGAILSAIDNKGTGIPPADPISFQAIPGNEKVTISWELKSDIELDGMSLVKTSGIKIVRKDGEFPENVNDGTEVVNSNEISGIYEDTGLTNGTEYFYRGFTYSDHSVYNLNDSCKKSAIPTEQEVCRVSVSTPDALTSLGDEYASVITLVDSTAHTEQTKSILNGAIGSVSFNVPVGDTYTLKLKISKATYRIVDGQIVIDYTDVPSIIKNENVYLVGEAEKGPYTAEIANTREVAFELEKIKIVTFNAGTDEEIDAMITASDKGLINLSEYWAVGDERTVALSAMTAAGTDVWNDGTLDGTTSFTVGEAQAEQTVTLVIMHFGDVPLADGNTCKMVVGQKNSLGTYGYMNSSNTNSGSWGSTARRKWCNNTYFNALPEYIRKHLKTMLTKSMLTETGSDWQTVNDRIALPSVAQVWESSGPYMPAHEFDSIDGERVLKQWDWYKTAANRIKKQGDTGSAYSWRERSPSDYSSARGQCFCCVYTDGSAGNPHASLAYGLAPFGCV